jgi:hypothetical protein
LHQKNEGDKRKSITEMYFDSVFVFKRNKTISLCNNLLRVCMVSLLKQTHILVEIMVIDKRVLRVKHEHGKQHRQYSEHFIHGCKVNITLNNHFKFHR